MGDKPNRFFVFFVFSFYFGWVTAQETIQVNYRNTPLKKVLLDVEAKTPLLVSYSEELVSNYRISIQEENISLDDLFEFLEQETDLRFERIGQNQIIVSQPKTTSSVCGYLFDLLTKEALPYATLVIQGTTKGFTTDDTGYFTIENEDISTGILVQYVGYADRVLFMGGVDGSDCKPIFLNPKAESLQEVVVQSYLTRGIDKGRDGSLILNSEEQGVLPGLVEPDVFQSVQWVPGITSVGETVSDIQIRGGSADQNLVLFDGIKMYNTGHFFGMVSIFNPNVTTGATLFKGGADAEYGERISGVIDIRGETQIPERTSYGLGLNGTQLDAFVKAQLSESVGLVVSGRRSHGDFGNVNSPTFEAISEKVFQNTVVGESNGEETELEGEDDLFFYDAHIKLLVKPSERDSMYLSGLLTKNDLNFRLRDDGDLITDVLTSQNEGLGFNWSGTKGKRWFHTLSGYYSNYKSDYQNRFLEDDAPTEENFRSNSVKDLGLNANLRYELNSRHSLKLGYQWVQNQVLYQLNQMEIGNAEDAVNETSNTKNTTHSLYGTYTFRPLNRGLVGIGF
ncbi:MAG: carboxypeptidase-like regulatory domain-containing protein, partial [Bacteroidota bacterium]